VREEELNSHNPQPPSNSPPKKHKFKYTSYN